MEHPASEKKRVGLNIFTEIMNAWSQSVDAQMRLLGMTDVDTFNELKRQSSTDISDDSLIRISYLMRIHKSLHTIFTNETQANSWVNRANTKYQNLSASEYMQSNGIEGLEEVCNYLFAQCH